MAFSDYLPGISAAIADVAKTQAAVQAMRFDSLVQLARMKQNAKSQQEAMQFEREMVDKKARLDVVSENLRWEHEQQKIVYQAGEERDKIEQEAKLEYDNAVRTGNTAAARNALLNAQTKQADIEMKSYAFKTASEPLNTFWKDRDMTPDMADDATKAEYNAMVDQYNAQADTYGWVKRPRLNTAKPVAPNTLMQQLPEAPAGKGVFGTIKSAGSGIYDWWNNLGGPRPESTAPIAKQSYGGGGGGAQ